MNNNINDEDEEEQRPLTAADIRALLDKLLEEQEERINATHKDEIHALLDEQEERINAAHQEEIRAHKEEMRLLEEATDRRFKNLEQASASSSLPQDTINDIAGATQTDDEILPLADNQRSSNTQLTPNRPRRGIAAILSFLLFQRERNEGSGGDHDDEAGNDRIEVLEEDTYSLMMLNKPSCEISCCPPIIVKILRLVGFWGVIILASGVINMDHRLRWPLVILFFAMMAGPVSCPWHFSLFTFWLQGSLGIYIILDQAVPPEKFDCNQTVTCDLFSVPIGSRPFLTVVQYLAGFLALTMQKDIFSSLQILEKLRNADNVPWDEVIGQPGNRTWGLWLCRILLPNIFKFSQAAVILLVTFIVIVQNTSVLTLLKEFTSLLVVSQADNIMFIMANQGYFGNNLKRKTEEVKAARWMITEDARGEGDTDEDEEEKPHCWCSCCNMSSCIFFTLTMVMIGGLTYVLGGQYTGRYMRLKFKECDAYPTYLIGNGWCNDHAPYNTPACGYDGGDCDPPE